MAKIYGLFGSMTGKLADTVMSVRNGEQIARKYQPVVYNPSTPAQVANRAKMKLMSQLSAVMAPVIAIRKEGNVSSRNLFVKKNFGAATYETDTASVNLNAIQLTNSVVGLGDFNVTRGEGSAVTASVASTGLSRAVFIAFVKQADNTLRLSRTVVVSEAVEDAFTAQMNLARTFEYVVYAYGVRDNTEAARTAFGDMQAITAEQVAKLIATRTLLETDITLTETKAQTLTIPQE